MHSEFALLANVMVAAEGTPFNDIPHFAGGICAVRRNLYCSELQVPSRYGGNVPAEPQAAEGEVE